MWENVNIEELSKYVEEGTKNLPVMRQKHKDIGPIADLK